MRLSKEGLCEDSELEAKVENAFNQKIDLQGQNVIDSKTKSYQIQRGLSLLFVFYR